ncbi:hypothetical protein P5673_032025 [Acropora cervicornis]|uniref:Uncharacterized protein n=1 Tax=Acropora cervicornis TaxID=6130 RepID=A0AAD9PSI0_ACRCE|nr:hypothetical protein P5673_032025 [Acropora cervicornis]
MNDKWKGVQQEIKRKDINPDGPLDIGNETSEQDLEDSEDNVPLKELVRKESAQPENVSATETKCYEEYIMKRNERLQTNQDETVREKSAPKGKHGITKGKTDPKDKAILDLKDITKQHQTSGAKEGASKRKLDMTCVQSGKADPPQPGQPLDFVKRHRQGFMRDFAVPERLQPQVSSITRASLSKLPSS